MIIAPPPPLPALSVKGPDVVDASGRKVLLRGVNLGGWLVVETWMTPWVEEGPAGDPKADADVPLWATLTKRFGPAGMRRVRDAWRTNWIADADFARIKGLGLDHVRIPFLHELLDEPGGLDLLKKAVERAGNAGLYTILDMHGTPGRQSGDHVTGERGKNRLWFDVENITEMARKWTLLGRTFGKDPRVAAFDLMNEPTGAPNPAMLHLVYDRVYRAVRKVAPTKPIIVDDGYKGFETTPHPNLADWTGIIFSLHFYTFDAKTREAHLTGLDAKAPRLKELQGYRNAPLYIGEFSVEPFGHAALVKEYTRKLTGQGWGWAIWTYKTASRSGPLGGWGLFRTPEKTEGLDPFRDDEENLIRKIVQYRTDNMRPAPGYDAAFRP